MTPNEMLKKLFLLSRLILRSQVCKTRRSRRDSSLRAKWWIWGTQATLIDQRVAFRAHSENSSKLDRVFANCRPNKIQTLTTLAEWFRPTPGIHSQTTIRGLLLTTISQDCSIESRLRPRQHKEAERSLKTLSMKTPTFWFLSSVSTRKSNRLMPSVRPLSRKGTISRQITSMEIILKEI